MWTSSFKLESIRLLFTGDIFSPKVSLEDSLPFKGGAPAYFPWMGGSTSASLLIVSNLNETPLYAHDAKEKQIKVLNSSVSNDWGSKEYLAQELKLLKCLYTQIGEFCRLESSVETDLRMRVQEAISAKEPSYLQRGLAWVSYGLLFLNGYITDYPLDPVEIRKQKANLAESQLSKDLAYLRVIMQTDYLRFGQVEMNSHKSELLNKIEMIRDKKVKLGTRLPIRPQLSRIQEIHTDLLYLKNEVVNLNKTLELLTNVSNGTDIEISLLEEESLQNLLDSILEQMKSSYPMYSDFLGPIYICLRQFKFGLRYLRAHLTTKKATRMTSLIKMLLNCSKPLEVSELKIASGLVLPQESNLLLAIVDKKSSTMTKANSHQGDTVEIMVRLFYSLFDNWKNLEVEIQNDVDDKTLVIDENDDEIFQDYAEEFNVDSPAESGHNSRIEDFQKLKLSIYHLFLRFANGLNNAVSQDSLISNLKASFENIFHRFSESLIAESTVLTSNVDTDNIIRSGLVYMTNFHSQQFECRSSGKYDFYNDSNISQARNITPALLVLDEKLNLALDHWPDHTVLKTLSALIMKLLSMPITTPLIKLLVGLEVLMIKTDEWEAYSSKEYSLREPMVEIIKLIVTWRKLELESWSDLLAVEDYKGHVNVANELPNMWKVVVGSIHAEQKVL